jgi:hypothetical protein
MKRLPVLFLILMTLAACNRAPGTAYRNLGPAQAETNMPAPPLLQPRAKFLAYEHHVSIDTEGGKVKQLLDKLSAACAGDRDNSCTLISSSLEGGREEHAELAVRVKPAGVAKLLAMASAGGEVASQETSVQDLARVVTDNTKRLDMLRAYQQKLMDLERKGGGGVDGLIKLSKELADVQSELEAATGENAALMERINLDVLKISIFTRHQQSFSAPIHRALADFASNLSEGIANFVTGLAYLLPWGLLMFVLLVIARKLWRRRKAR